MINAAELASKFETLLNTNTLGLKYRLYYWLQDLDRRFEKVDGVNEQFIPAMIISTSGRYRPIPNANISDSEFIFNIFYPQKYKDDVVLSLDEFAGLVVGKKMVVDSKTIVCNMDIPMPNVVQVQQLKELNELDSRLSLDESQIYGVVQIRVYYMTTSTYLVGNDVAFSLKKKADSTYVSLARTDATIGNVRALSSEQMIDDGTGTGKKTSDSVAQSNATTKQVTFYFDPTITLISDIVKDLDAGTNQNQVYTLKIDYGSSFSTTQDVIIKDGVVSPPLGNITTMALTVVKAGSEL